MPGSPRRPHPAQLRAARAPRQASLGCQLQAVGAHAVGDAATGEDRPLRIVFVCRRSAEDGHSAVPCESRDHPPERLDGRDQQIDRADDHPTDVSGSICPLSVVEPTTSTDITVTIFLSSSQGRSDQRSRLRASRSLEPSGACLAPTIETAASRTSARPTGSSPTLSMLGLVALATSRHDSFRRGWPSNVPVSDHASARSVAARPIPGDAILLRTVATGQAARGLCPGRGLRHVSRSGTLRSYLVERRS